MSRIVLLSMLCLLLPTNAALSKSSDSENVYEVMRGIGIKYLISEDRKLPKKNRKKWEKNLSHFVDFSTLNSGMRKRVRRAASKGENAITDNDTLTYLEEKAVLFLIPRELSDFTVLYLRAMDNVTQLQRCDDNLKPSENKKYLLCEQKTNDSEVGIKIIIPSEENVSLIFKKTDRWRLSNIKRAISEKMLLLIGRWK